MSPNNKTRTAYCDHRQPTYKIMKHYTILALLAVSAVLLKSCSNANGESENTRPNIVLIMADDLGYSDLGCYGGEIQTPNIDWLAKNGLRFTQFYNTSRCCPTRASLLTGLYNQQAGIGNMTIDEHLPGYRGHLTKNTVTLAELLKKAGYHTAMAGKWHVSNTPTQPTKAAQLDWLNHQAFHPYFSPVEQYPTNKGFEKFYGTIWGVVDYFDPFSLVYGTQPVKNVPEDYYHTDAINDSAAAFIRQFSKDDQPFFVYVAENAPHWPVMALPEDIAKYKDTYKAGWEAVREARYQKMVDLGLVDPATTKLSGRWHPKLTWANNPDSAWDARVMAVHAAMVDRMDQGIGRIIEALKETGELDNTLILFLSDNGASPEICANFGPGFDRPGETREGEKIVYAKNKAVMPGPENVYASIGPRWANVANTPYRYWKAWSYEGGVRTPMIAFWPEGITAKKGSVVQDVVGHVMDFMPTFIQLADARYPKEYKGNEITPMEGISLVPAFKGEKTEARTLFNAHHGGRYVRTGHLKMVSRNGDTTWSLYDLQKDGSETNNIVKQHPQQKKTMDSLWRAWADKVHVFPKPGKTRF